MLESVLSLLAAMTTEQPAEPIVRFRTSPHAEREMERRGIDAALVKSVLAVPGQRLAVRGGMCSSPRSPSVTRRRCISCASSLTWIETPRRW